MEGISERYRGEVAEILAGMAERVRRGEKTATEFLAAQSRLLTAYRKASAVAESRAAVGLDS